MMLGLRLSPNSRSHMTTSDFSPTVLVATLIGLATMIILFAGFRYRVPLG